ncbi:MAPEG family protein [Shewanella algidipiscicola]|uniref:Glutathione S-transferase n=1 Tax=Shewanella algidipiscicola TaxID=614070 RepID=A0ABQ4PKJ5_9GAMM|nr:MAPEG family protein [Shewanella algidipiscicola]GIU48151.1 glutathione S-transferase [Shewanella algidipiscicola]
MSVTVSSLYIGLTAIMAVYFALRVVKLRRRLKVGLGVDDQPTLRLANRVHGNLIEHAPMALILLLVAELNGLPHGYLHLLGLIWLLARVLHALGLTLGQGGYHVGRFWGVLLTWIVILTLSVVNIGYFIIGA